MAQWLSDSPLQEALERLEWERRRLQVREQEWRAISPRNRSRHMDDSRADRSFSFVYCSGALEDLFRILNSSIAQDLRRVRVPVYELRPSSLSMLFPKVWDQINIDRVIKLTKRRELTDRVGEFYMATGLIEFGALDALGISDGRTVGAHHFEALWEGMCLSRSREAIWMSDSHRLAVTSLAEKRNTIAHFETDPRVEALRYSYTDLFILVGKIVETVQRLREHVFLH